MDFLQIALIFLIFLLSIFLAITGFQVFFILRDLQRSLKRLNQVLEHGETPAPSNLMVSLSEKAKAFTKAVKSSRTNKPKPNRFYKKVL